MTGFISPQRIRQVAAIKAQRDNALSANSGNWTYHQ